jgi:hypothetical protein
MSDVRGRKREEEERRTNSAGSDPLSSPWLEHRAIFQLHLETIADEGCVRRRVEIKLSEEKKGSRKTRRRGKWGEKVVDEAARTADGVQVAVGERRRPRRRRRALRGR